MNQKKIIELLEAMNANAHSVAECFKHDGDSSMYKALIHEAIGMQTAIYCMRDLEYFKSMCEIYNVE